MSEIFFELEQISEDTRATFGHLSAEQINWKPSAEGWSVGQCFEHLIKTNSLFFPDLDAIANGTRKSSLVEKYSPLSGFFGNFLINSLQKDERKFKAPSQKIVPPSDVAPDIIEQFAAHQREVIGKLKRAENVDWQKTIVTSPFMKLATYTLSDGCRSIVEHEKRHFRQAKRVLDAEGFPKN